MGEDGAGGGGGGLQRGERVNEEEWRERKMQKKWVKKENASREGRWETKGDGDEEKREMKGLIKGRQRN